MKSSELANRYAKALYELSVDQKSQEKVFAQLRELDKVFTDDKAIHDFLVTPLVSAADREKTLAKILVDKGLNQEVLDLVLLLARNDRFGLFHEMVHAFEAQSDAANNVCRGTVRSATTLGPTERQRIQETVERVMKKKVILTYKADPTVIGGLVAQVGSYTFDDSIESHLTRMNEELKRRTV